MEGIVLSIGIIVATSLVAAGWLWITRGQQSLPMSTTVTIGRNVGPQPMSAGRWDSYRHDVLNTLTDDGATVVADADYRGQWEGQSEDAHVDVALWPAIEPADLDADLARIGRTYGQDAVGVSTGKARLV